MGSTASSGMPYLQNVMKLNLQLVMTRNLKINFGKSGIARSTMSFVFVTVVLLFLFLLRFKNINAIV